MDKIEKKEKFIKNAKKIWKNYFDFSKVTYVDSKTNVEILHDGISYWQRPDHILEGRIPYELSEKHKYTMKEWKTKLFNKFPLFKYEISEKSKYVNAFTKSIIMVCHKIGNDGKEHGEFKISPNSVFAGSGNGNYCPKCKGERLHDLLSMEKKDFVKKAESIYHGKYDYTDFNYYNSKTKGKVLCKKHKEYFYVTPNNHISMHKGCPICSMSKMEDKIYNFLKEKNIPFKYQFSIKGKNKRKYDFYLPTCNMIIECQGEQHFRPVTFGGTLNEAITNYEKQKRTDFEKYEYALEKGYKYMFFIDRNIIKVTDEELSSEFYKDKEIIGNIEELSEAINKASF